MKKAIKIILTVVLVIIAIPLTVAIFVDKDYSMECEIIINKPKHEVFDYVKYLKNQNNYSKWAAIDPNMETYFRGTDAGVGFVSGWKSKHKDVGHGEQEIKKIVDGERIDYELRFIEPFESTEQGWMSLETVADSSTKVKWGFRGRMNYPMNVMLLLYDFEKMLSDDFNTGLSNLKNIMEKN
jgi:uncharacterized protein YndB with AHSA1/START domain